MNSAESSKPKIAETPDRRGFIQGLLKTGAGSAISISGISPVAAEEDNLAWKFQTGDQVWSSPAVVDDTIYIGSHDSNLYALDIDSGDEKWRFQTNDIVWLSPAVGGDTVYFCSNNESGSDLYAVDVNSGEEQWRGQTNETIYSSPVVEDRTVYVGGGGVFSGFLYAVDTDSGQQQWSITFDSRVNSCSTVVDGMIYIGTSNERLYAINTTTSEVEWDFETEGDILSTPAVAGNIIYFGSQDGNLYALDVDSGEELWRFETDRPIDTLPTVADETVYFGNWDNNLYALDANSGEEQWHFETESSIRVSPTVADGKVYFMSDNLYVVDVDSGEEQWHFETDDSVGDSPESDLASSVVSERSTPTVVENTVYFGSIDSHIYALDTEAGSETDWLGALIIVCLLGIYGFAHKKLAGNDSVENEEFTDREPNEISHSEYPDSVLKFVKTRGWTANITELRDGTDIIAGKRETDTGPEKMLLMIVCNPEDEVTSEHVEYLLKAGREKNVDSVLLTYTVGITENAQEIGKEYGIGVIDSQKVRSHSEAPDFDVDTDEIQIPNSGSVTRNFTKQAGNRDSGSDDDTEINNNHRSGNKEGQVTESDPQSAESQNGKSFKISYIITYTFSYFIGFGAKITPYFAAITIPIIIVLYILGISPMGLRTWLFTVIFVPTLFSAIVTFHNLVTDGVPAPE